MMMVGHTALGVAAGLATGNPIAAVAVGVVSHHLADWTPHYDPGSHVPEAVRVKNPIHIWTTFDWIFVTIDLLLTVLLLIWFFPFINQPDLSVIAAGILGANLPDLVHNVPFWNKRLRKIAWIRWWQDHIHRRYQSTVTLRYWYWGVLTQVATIGLVAWYVMR